MADWYYLKDGERDGPLDDEALLDAVGNGTVAHTDLIWCEGMGDWQPAAELMEFEEVEGNAAAATAAATPTAAATTTSAAPAAAAVPAAASSQAWYYLANGEQTGPVSIQQLGALCADGTLSSDDLIWTESLGDWKKVSDVDAVASAVSGAPAAAAASKPVKGVKLGGQKKKTVVRKTTGGKGKKAVAAATAGAVAVGATAAAAATAVGSSASDAVTGAVGAAGATPDTPDNRDGHWVYPGFKWLITSFKGRIPRKKFWIGGILLYLLFLVMMIPVVGLAFVGGKAVVMDMIGGTIPESIPILVIVAMMLGFLLYLLVFWFALSIQVKRWHDRGKSGWWVLIGLVPVVGIWAFIECGFLEGTVGPNEYGPDPLGRK